MQCIQLLALGNNNLSLQIPLQLNEMEDLDRSRESLLRVLHHHELRPIFVEFCEQEHNSENVELWLGLQRFNALHAAGDTDKQARYASKIVDKFVRDSAPKQVNMREVC